MIELKLSREMVLIIGEALSNAPYKISAPVIAELQRQVNEQEKAHKLKVPAA